MGQRPGFEVGSVFGTLSPERADHRRWMERLGRLATLPSPDLRVPWAVGPPLQGSVLPGGRSPWELPRALLARPFGPLKCPNSSGTTKSRALIRYSRQFSHTLFSRYKDIGRLDVTVSDALRVRRIQPVGDLDREVQQLVRL